MKTFYGDVIEHEKLIVEWAQSNKIYDTEFYISPRLIYYNSRINNHLNVMIEFYNFENSRHCTITIYEKIPDVIGNKIEVMYIKDRIDFDDLKEFVTTLQEVEVFLKSMELK